MTSDPLNSPEPTELFPSQGPRKSTDPVDTPVGFDTPPVAWSSGLNEPLTKLEVEDEVLEAVEEGKEDAEPYQEAEEAEAEAKAPEEASKVAAREEKNKRLRGNPTFIAGLRNADAVDEKTCGYCLGRKPLGDFARGKTSNFCIDCEGK